MKAPHFYITVTLSTIALVMSIYVIILSQGNQRLQAQLQRQQDEINKGNSSLQVSQNLLHDMAELSVKNDKIKQVLARNGYTVQQNATPAPSPAK